MPHAARQFPAWLSFDVGQTMKPPPPKALVLLAAFALMTSCAVPDVYRRPAADLAPQQVPEIGKVGSRTGLSPGANESSPLREKGGRLRSATSTSEVTNSPGEPKPEVVMPVMKVSSTRVERFGLALRGEKMWIWHVPTKSDMFAMLIAGGQVYDEIVSIDGRDIATIPNLEGQGLLNGYFTIVVKRRVGRHAFKLLELKGRSD